MKTRFLITILFCTVNFATATAQTDSTKYMEKMAFPDAGNNPGRSKFNLSRLHHSFCVAAPVAVIGFSVMPADHPIRDRVVNGMPTFHCGADEYIQYAPLAAQLTLSLCGVKGRSRNCWQVLTADAMAAGMMAVAVNGMKYGINRTRPNGGHNSFPSGHTATAFMGATLLAHEYGHKSVWIPIGGYTVATATGVLRILNNKHYASDVIVGAAIGILTAELGYWATDAIFNDRKIFKSRRARLHYEVLKNY